MKAEEGIKGNEMPLSRKKRNKVQKAKVAAKHKLFWHHLPCLNKKLQQK